LEEVRQEREKDIRTEMMLVIGLKLQQNKYVTSDITSNMIPLLFLGSIGTKGALMLGLAAAEPLYIIGSQKKLLVKFTFLVDEFIMVKLEPYYRCLLYSWEKFLFLQQH
jgi:hypothetical protein